VYNIKWINQSNKSIKESIEKLLRVVTRDDKYTIEDMDNEINNISFFGESYKDMIAPLQEFDDLKEAMGSEYERLKLPHTLAERYYE